MEKDRLLFCIGRFDQYYDSVNNKGNVILALSTFLVGSEIAAYPFFLENRILSVYAFILYGLTIMAGFSAIIMILRASIPYTSCEHKSSLWFFRDIANLSSSGFNERSKTLTDDEELMDLRTQTHDLAIGLKKKFYRLKIAGNLLIVQLSLLVPFFTIVYKNLK
jgi:hypothetical protein